jgi:hypothetical protein
METMVQNLVKNKSLIIVLYYYSLYMPSLEDLKPSKNKFLKHKDNNEELNKIDKLAEEFIDKRIKYHSSFNNKSNQNENQS